MKEQHYHELEEALIDAHFAPTEVQKYVEFLWTHAVDGEYERHFDVATGRVEVEKATWEFQKFCRIHHWIAGLIHRTGGF